MGLSHITVIAAISLSGLLPSSCTKTPAKPQHAQVVGTNSVVAQSNAKNLGVIQLTNHYETEIDLGQGNSCIITPRLIDHSELQLTLSFGTKNADGKPTGLSVTRVTAQSDKPFEITVNDMNMSFTPRLLE